MAYRIPRRGLVLVVRKRGLAPQAIRISRNGGVSVGRPTRRRAPTRRRGSTGPRRRGFLARLFG